LADFRGNIGLFIRSRRHEIPRADRLPGAGHKLFPTSLCDTAPYLFPTMSVASELRRRVRAEQSLPRYEPCLPRPAKQPPAGPGWIHEIKHNGFRIIAPDTLLIDKLLIQAWGQK
jgi:hypothetical protein